MIGTAGRPLRPLDTPEDGVKIGESWGTDGARRCIGANFALIEARVVLRTMLRHAELLPTHERSERISRRNVTIVPARGGRITLKKLPPAAWQTRAGETAAGTAARDVAAISMSASSEETK